MKKLSLKTTFNRQKPVSAAEFLAELSGLSKMRIKDAMNKGAVWIRKKKGGLQRLRKASTDLLPGAMIELYYDETLLSQKPPKARCVSDQGDYSVWFKPAGLLSQGTKYGDHCSLMRQADIFFGQKRKIYLVHRLDREASGLMLLGHSKEAAAKLSELFQNDRITKKYRTEVKGNLMEKDQSGKIDLPLDNRPAITEYEVETYDPERNLSTVGVIIRTGRMHQIRRHFEMIGFPVIGDPRYGIGNKNDTGMRLEAISLAFRCPFSDRDVEYRLDWIPGKKTEN